MGMKALLIMWMLLLVPGLVFSPVFAVEYCKDFLESGNPGGWYDNSLKTFDDEWTMEVGGEVELDIWVNDVPFALLSGGFWIEYDPSKVSIVSVDVYDGFNGPPGPWEVAFTLKVPDAGGPGTYLVAVSPPLIPAAPDGDGDLIIGKIRFHCESEGDAIITISTIPGLDTFVADTTVFDHDMFPNQIVIHQQQDVCEGDFDCDQDCDGADAAVFKSGFGRSPFSDPCTLQNPCIGDFDGDEDCDGTDAAVIKLDFGRSPFSDPCPPCVTTTSSTITSVATSSSTVTTTSSTGSSSSSTTSVEWGFECESADDCGPGHCCCACSFVIGGEMNVCGLLSDCPGSDEMWECYYCLEP
jgi:hypothetical protein